MLSKKKKTKTKFERLYDCILDVIRPRYIKYSTYHDA